MKNSFHKDVENRLHTVLQILAIATAIAVVCALPHDDADIYPRNRSWTRLGEPPYERLGGLGRRDEAAGTLPHIARKEEECTQYAPRRLHQVRSAFTR